MKRRTAGITAPVLRQVGQAVAGEVKRRKPRTATVSPSEQLDRFIQGAERWRVDAGLVTPEQYARYSDAMLKRLNERI